MLVFFGVIGQGTGLSAEGVRLVLAGSRPADPGFVAVSPAPECGARTTVNIKALLNSRACRIRRRRDACGPSLTSETVDFSTDILSKFYDLPSKAFSSVSDGTML